MIWLVALLAAYLALLFVISYLSLHPTRIPVFFSPGALGSPQEEVELPSGSLTLRGWLVPVEDPKSVAVLVHGYLMNRSELAVIAHKLAQRGCASLLVELRCHGRSGGTKTGLGYLERDDVRSAIDFVRQRYPKAKVALIGSSMGAAASAFATAANPQSVDALVLDSCYSRLPSAVVGWWRFLGGPPLAALLAPTVAICAPMAGFNPYKVDVAAALAKLEGDQVLLLHGERDTLALPAEAKRNAMACKGSTLRWFPGCGHSEARWIHPGDYDDALFAFLAKRNII